MLLVGKVVGRDRAGSNGSSDLGTQTSAEKRLDKSRCCGLDSWILRYVDSDPTTNTTSTNITALEYQEPQATMTDN